VAYDIDGVFAVVKLILVHNVFRIFRKVARPRRTHLVSFEL
jgi:hypothetical protein